MAINAKSALRTLLDVLILTQKPRRKLLDTVFLRFSNTNNDMDFEFEHILSDIIPHIYQLFFLLVSIYENKNCFIHLPHAFHRATVSNR